MIESLLEKKIENKIKTTGIPQMDSMKKFAKNMSRQLSTQSCLPYNDRDVEASKQLQIVPTINRQNDLILQRLTSVEERNHRRKMRQIFQLVRTPFNYHIIISFD